MWWLMVGGCSLAGLEELNTLPSGFPLGIDAETGHITRTRDGNHVAVDVVFKDRAEAQTGWRALQQQAESNGWIVTNTAPGKKLDQVFLKGPDGRLVLACCRPRADRRWMAYVSWFKQ